MRQIDMKTRASASPSWCDTNTTDLDIDTSICYVDNRLTLEDLMIQHTTCFSCGVSWNDDHVSLDCLECGGYSMQRPCPICEGRCGKVWQRDCVMSQAMNKAHWEGECGLPAGEQASCYLTNVVEASPDSVMDAISDLNMS